MWDKPVWLDSGNFSVRVYLPLIWMFSATHMHSLTVHVITGLPFARYLSQESSPASNLCFWLALSHSAFFFLYLVTFFLFIHGFSFYFIKHRWHSLDQHLLKCLSLETLTSMIRTGSPILVEMVDLVNFVISNKRTQMVNFPTQIWEFDSHNPAILDFFFFSDAGICSAMAFPPLRNSDHVVVSVSIDVPWNSQWDACFIACFMSTLVLIGMVFVIIWGIFHGRISLKSVLLLLLENFLSGFRLELMYLSLILSIM